METLNYIIPVWRSIYNQVKGEDFEYRINNINQIISESLAKQKTWKIHLIIIEQRINGRLHFFDKINIPESMNATLLEAEYFIPNKCWLNNLAVKRSKGKHLVFAESDTICEPDHFKKLFSYIFNNRVDWCIGWKSLEYLTKDRRIDRAITVREGKGAEGGLVYFDKGFFNYIGKYNEWIEDLGGPDNEIAIRARYMSMKNNICSGTISHLWHPVVRNDRVCNSTRIRNSKIFKFTKTHSIDVVDFLKNEKQGNNNGPACKNKPFPFEELSK